MQPVRQDILNAVEDRLTQGQSFRIRHKFQQSGAVCSKVTDDPAMVVTRVIDGWVYNCHRCHDSGKICDNTLNSKQTRARIEALKKIPIDKKSKEIRLPFDYTPMGGKVDDSVPWDAYHWIWKYSLTTDNIMRFEFGWSAAYQRVIIPLYEWTEMGDSLAKKLVGWVGRDTTVLSKAERKEKGIPKYLTRSQKDKRRYFMTPGDKNTVVICEDCLSAIKVFLATGYCTIALLNTDIGDNLMRWLRGREIFLWLDGDMVAQSVKKVERMRQLGLNIKRLYTPKDPKEYNLLYILDVIREGEKRGKE